MPGKKDIISLLEKISDLMEFKGENQFKVNAFRSGANSIRKYEGDIEEITRLNELHKIKGIGKTLQAVIYEFYESGESSLYKELKKEVPEGIEELLKVSGIGPKKINILSSELGVTNIGELEYACKENRLALLKGFGEATQKKILEEIKKLKVYSKYILLNAAGKYSDEILEKISPLKSISKVAVTGELRRGMEIISNLEFIVLTNDLDKLCGDINKHFTCKKEKDKIKLENGFSIPVFIYPVLSEKEFTSKMFLTTGSREFIDKLKLPESFKSSYKTENEIFEELDIPFIIPEMRERQYLEIKNADLKKNSDLCFNHFKGLLHFHSTYSDGKDTLYAMLREAEKIGFEYAAVCDHSKSAVYANGLSEERILLQLKEVKEITSKNKLLVFQGIESDILQYGSLDYNDEFLKNFDFVVASIHSRFNMEQDEMTKRIIKAIENPYTDLLAHPTGRLLLSRDPFKVDQKKIIDACSKNNVAIEINANPHRLDLDWRMVYYAREKGCWFSINPDAHSLEEIPYIEYGIMMGRKAGLQSEEVINCFDKEKFKEFLKRKVKRNF